jgi:hypothetical protein
MCGRKMGRHTCGLLSVDLQVNMVGFSDVLCRYSLGTNPRGVKDLWSLHLLLMWLDCLHSLSCYVVTHACIIVTLLLCYSCMHYSYSCMHCSYIVKHTYMHCSTR